MRFSKEQAAATREHLVATAGRLFRAHGMDGVGVAEVAKAAGVTHGAIYAHFPSKEALATAALEAGLRRSLVLMLASAEDEEATFAGYVDFLLSPHMRDTLDMGCPMTASASEIGRRSMAMSTGFAAGFEAMVDAIAAACPGEMPKARRRALAITAVAAELGAIAIARAVAKSAPDLSDEVLKAVRTELGHMPG